MERYEFINGTSSKFWEVEVVDKKMIVRWGRIGTHGQGQEKIFSSDDLAKGAMKNLVSKTTLLIFSPEFIE